MTSTMTLEEAQELMADLGKTVQDESGASRPDNDPDRQEDHSSSTAGTDRDYDESGEAKNQGHGHPRGGNPGSDDAGHSEKRITEADRQERDLGGPGG